MDLRGLEGDESVWRNDGDREGDCCTIDLVGDRCRVGGRVRTSRGSIPALGDGNCFEERHSPCVDS